VAEDRADRSAVAREDVISAWVVPLIVEAIGPLALCFVGIGSIMATNNGNLLVIAVAHGLVIGLMVAAAGHISGGVYNPALTLGLAIARRLAPVKAVAYVIAQLIGALVGALLIKAVFGTAVADAPNINLGTPGVGQDFAFGPVGTALSTVNFTAGGAVLAEIVATFFLMYVVFGTAVDGRSIGKAVAPLAIGLTITIDILAVGPVSGAAMNPSRWFGPAVVQATFDDWLVYWVGPGIGAAIAAILYGYIYLPREQATGE
jgi:MIP family channel proteins